MPALTMSPIPNFRLLKPGTMMPDIQDVSSARNAVGPGFISAKTALLLQAGTVDISKRTNERLARKIDAALIIDELKRGLYDLDDPPLPYALRRKLWDNQTFHFSDGRKLSYESM